MLVEACMQIIYVIIKSKWMLAFVSVILFDTSLVQDQTPSCSGPKVTAQCSSAWCIWLCCIELTQTLLRPSCDPGSISLPPPCDGRLNCGRFT